MDKPKLMYRHKTVDPLKDFRVLVAARTYDEELSKHKQRTRNLRRKNDNATKTEKKKRVIIPGVDEVSEEFYRGGRTFSMPSSYINDEEEPFPEVYDGSTINYDCTEEDERFLITNFDISQDQVEHVFDLLEKAHERSTVYIPISDILENWNLKINLTQSQATRIEAHWKRRRSKRQAPGFNYPIGKPFLRQFVTVASHRADFNDGTVPFRGIYREYPKRRKWRNDNGGMSRLRSVYEQLGKLREMSGALVEREKLKLDLLDVDRRIMHEKAKMMKVKPRAYLKRTLPVENAPLTPAELPLSHVTREGEAPLVSKTFPSRRRMRPVAVPSRRNMFAFLCDIHPTKELDVNAYEEQPRFARIGRYGNIYSQSDPHMVPDPKKQGFAGRNVFTECNVKKVVRKKKVGPNPNSIPKVLIM